MGNDFRCAALASTFAAALALLFPPSEVRAAVLEARSADGDLVLVSTPRQESYLIRADGSRVALPLPETALVHSLAATGAEWYAAAVDAGAAGRRLVVLKGSAAKVKELPAPAVTAAAQLREPQVLLGARGLAGLAWIEGVAPRRQTVRAAAWTVSGWKRPVTVSPPGPGSQMALAAARLGDGSWLLAWDAFDGGDDEILWSRWSAGGASRPQRLGADNAVPDITPRLWPAAGGGALAAWSRYDGNDYRLQLARFDGGAWAEPETAGPRGSLYPAFYDGPQGPLLVYLKALPRAWVVAELDGRGTVLRRAEVESLRVERPIVAGATGDSVSLMWIGRGGEPETVSGLAWRPVEPASR